MCLGFDSVVPGVAWTCYASSNFVLNHSVQGYPEDPEFHPVGHEFLIISGKTRMMDLTDGKSLTAGPGDYIYIPAYHKHKVPPPLPPLFPTHTYLFCLHQPMQAHTPN